MAGARKDGRIKRYEEILAAVDAVDVVEVVKRRRKA